MFDNFSKEKIGERIVSERERKNIKQGELAETINVSKSQMSKIERGTGPEPNLKDLLKIANSLNVRVQYLLGLDSYRNEQTSRLMNFFKLFGSVSTTHKERVTIKDIYSSDDFDFTIDGDYIVLSGSQHLFDIIKKVSIENNNTQDGSLRDNNIKSIPDIESGKKENTEKKARYLLVSPKQIKELIAEQEKITQRFDEMLITLQDGGDE